MLARKPNYDNHRPTFKEKNQNLRRKNKTNKRSKPKRNSNGYGTMFIIVITASIILFFLSGYAKITAIRTDINEMETLKTNLEKKQTNLKAELEGIKSSEAIIEEANLKLGMNHPSKDQIIYVSIPKEKKEKSLINTIKENINNGLIKVQSLFGRSAN